eukprot:jgi/Mesvir1/4750/Mv05538-RA.1
MKLEECDEGEVQLVAINTDTTYQVTFNTRGHPTNERITNTRVTRSRQAVQLSLQSDDQKLGREVESMQSKLAVVAQTLKDGFKERFPPEPFMQAWDVFFPEWWDEQARKGADVLKAIQPLLEHYCEEKTCKPPGATEPFTIPPLVDKAQLASQYGAFKGAMLLWGHTTDANGVKVFTPWRQYWCRLVQDEDCIESMSD